METISGLKLNEYVFRNFDTITDWENTIWDVNKYPYFKITINDSVVYYVNDGTSLASVFDIDSINANRSAVLTTIGDCYLIDDSSVWLDNKYAAKTNFIAGNENGEVSSREYGKLQNQIEYRFGVNGKAITFLNYAQEDKTTTVHDKDYYDNNTFTPYTNKLQTNSPEVVQIIYNNFDEYYSTCDKKMHDMYWKDERTFVFDGNREFLIPKDCTVYIATRGTGYYPSTTRDIPCSDLSGIYTDCYTYSYGQYQIIESQSRISGEPHFSHWMNTNNNSYLFNRDNNINKHRSFNYLGWEDTTASIDFTSVNENIIVSRIWKSNPLHLQDTYLESIQFNPEPSHSWAYNYINSTFKIDNLYDSIIYFLANDTNNISFRWKYSYKMYINYWDIKPAQSFINISLEIDPKLGCNSNLSDINYFNTSRTHNITYKGKYKNELQQIIYMRESETFTIDYNRDHDMYYNGAAVKCRIQDISNDVPHTMATVVAIVKKN